jgi:hypothetical protein
MPDPRAKSAQMAVKSPNEQQNQPKCEPFSGKSNTICFFVLLRAGF